MNARRQGRRRLGLRSIAIGLRRGARLSRRLVSRTDLGAGTPSPTQGLVRKGKVPVSDEILKIKLPRAGGSDAVERACG